jgi:uncharacterized protein affecting Mg2+/Co2+ transport
MRACPNTSQVEVEPQYLPDQSEPASELYGFAYTITVHNTGEVPAQLISRHWIITDARGHVEEVKGLGVVGQQPLLGPGEAFSTPAARNRPGRAAGRLRLHRPARPDGRGG